jgi:hypothetical protein
MVKTTVAPGDVVPIGWVAVGTPAQLFSADRHEEIWAVQRTLDFVETFYGVSGFTSMKEIMREQSEFYGARKTDCVISRRREFCQTHRLARGANEFRLWRGGQTPRSEQA